MRGISGEAYQRQKKYLERENDVCTCTRIDVGDASPEVQWSDDNGIITARKVAHFDVSPSRLVNQIVLLAQTKNEGSGSSITA